MCLFVYHNKSVPLQHDYAHGEACPSRLFLLQLDNGHAHPRAFLFFLLFYKINSVIQCSRYLGENVYTCTVLSKFYPCYVTGGDTS